MKMFTAVMPAAAVMMLLAPGFARQAAQPGGPIPVAFAGEDGHAAGARGGPGRGPTEEQREEIRKKIETVRIYRLSAELGLDPQTAAKLGAFLGSVGRKRRDISREQIESMGQLRAALRERDPDEKKLKDLLDRLAKSQRRMTAIRDGEMQGLEGILSVEQQARYLIFQRDFQQDIRRMIEQSRGEGPGRRPEGGAGGIMGPGGEGRPPW